MAGEDRELIVRDTRELQRPDNRRSFLRLLGVGGTVVLLPSIFAACGDDDDPTGPGDGAVTLDLRTDVGILNYAYALEQLEAAFYTQVVSGFAQNGITDAREREYLTDIRNHEIAHREFLKNALGEAAIGALAVDFGDALANRASVLQTARTFEDLGVAAYNGAGQYLEDPDFLTVAGKIVSVEARHASTIYAILNDASIFGPIDENGLDQAMMPSAVLTAADPFIETDVTISQGPA